MFCETQSAASKRYQWTVGWEMACYVLIMWGVDSFVRRHHPVGAELYALAALPLVPIVAVLLAVGVYLRDEKDEFQRDMTVKSILWGTSGVLGMSAFTGFLHSFGWASDVPPFTEFVTFWLLMAGSRAIYKWSDRPGRDEAMYEGGE